jgi:hypothetical protein
MKPLLLVVFITICPGGVGVAYADSDGYYCVGRGYLAYQFGMDTQVGPPHHLFVIRTAGATGIPEPLTLELPRFQVHGMRCGAGWVQVASFAAVYHVMLDESDKPSRYEERPYSDSQKIVEEFSLTQNLGPLSGGRAYWKPVRVRLSAKERGGGYFLEINAKTVSPSRKCELVVTSRIVETDRNGREINARLIFQGPGRRECGE